MKFLADESVDSGIVNLLRTSGHIVLSISEESPSIEDSEVLERAVTENSILKTEDKDFGELVYGLKLLHTGILLIRLSDLPRIERINLTAEIINLHGESLPGAFSVLTPGKLRVRKPM